MSHPQRTRLSLSHGSRRRRLPRLAGLTPGHRARRSVPGTVLALLAISALLLTSLAIPGTARAAATDDQPTSHARQHGYVAADCHTLSAAQQRSRVPFARCFAMALADRSGSVRMFVDGPPRSAMSPAELQNAYNIPSGGADMTVAVVVAGGYAHAESDLAVWREAYDLPPCTSQNGCFTKIDQRGGTEFPPENPDWSVEAALDLAAVSSACPQCDLMLVLGDSASVSDLGQAVQTAVAAGADVVSNSYGIAGEFPQQTQFDHYYDQPGVPVVASSGDTGGVPNWPATSPTVMAVGGTTLSTAPGSERGWHETVWGTSRGGDGAGSGCSLYEPRPAYQEGIETTCPDHRAIADVAADADPATGIAVYNTSGLDGWAQFGGTSLSAPLVAGIAAVAGTPAPESNPVSFLYNEPNKDAALFDVTEGANSNCGTVLCQAGPGWDGPTGLGTPNGTSAFSRGPTGQITGTVTDAASGDPLAGATVTATDDHGNTFNATTDGDGTYHLTLPGGRYDLTAAKFGYADQTRIDVAVTVDETVTQDFSLQSVPSHTLSGTVTDGSGHGWPVRAQITVEGYPGNAIFSDPYTGRYSLQLPRGDYTLHVAAADLPGYQTRDVTVTIGRSDVDKDIALPVAASTCVAPGYHHTYQGAFTAFEGWTDQTPQDGWTVTDPLGNGETWAFDDPSRRGNLTAGTGGFAIIDSAVYGLDGQQDSALVTPVIDLSGVDSPTIAFDTVYYGVADDVAYVDLSTDGGHTWTTVWQRPNTTLIDQVSISIPQAAGESAVQARFRYTGSAVGFWELDTVYVGKRQCEPVDGGLLAGVVTDHNTGRPVNQATVSRDGARTEFGVTAATPDDVHLPDGYYWLFSSHSGRTAFTAAKGRYQPTGTYADVPADWVGHQNISLDAGHVVVDTESISVHTQMGRTATRTISLTNDSDYPVQVRVNEHRGGFVPTRAGGEARTSGAPLMRIDSPLSRSASLGDRRAGHDGIRQRVLPRSHSGPTLRAALQGGSAAGSAWSPLADLPAPVADNLVAFHHGNVYSVGGVNDSGVLSSGYVYTPAEGQWDRIADLPSARHAAGGAFIGSRLYVTGGWDDRERVVAATYAYDPGSDTWIHLADMPSATAAAAATEMNGQLWVVGGCLDASCVQGTRAVYSYSPSTNTWTAHADYPVTAAFLGCAGIDGELVCAGGVNPASGLGLTDTYRYDPATDTWSQGADMPASVWGGAYAGSHGTLQVFGGAVNDAISNQAFEYDPAADEWSRLPNTNHPVYRGSGTCGLYKIGGATQNFQATAFAETLPGYTDCDGGVDVGWLALPDTELHIAPGETVTARIVFASGTVAQPGDYTASLLLASDTPYRLAPIDVDMHVQPPQTWGKIAGTVTDASGDPIPGATVQICTMWDRWDGCGEVTYTLQTDADGHYQLWLNAGYGPLSIIAAKNGYLPKRHLARLHEGKTTTIDFSLKRF